MDEDENIEKVNKVEHIWIHFGFITNYDGERDNGWKVLDKEPVNKKGVIKATMVYGL